MKVKLLSRLRLLAAPWTAAHQAPLPMGFSRQEYWSGVPLPSPFHWKVQTLYIVCTISFNIYVCMVLCLCVYVGSNDSLDFSARKYIKTTLIPLALLFSLHFTFSPLKSYQIYSLFKQPSLRTSLAVQWVGTLPSKAWGAGLIPSQEPRSLMSHGQKSRT